MKSIVMTVVGIIMMVLGWLIVEIEPMGAMVMIIAGAATIYFGIDFDRFHEWLNK